MNSFQDAIESLSGCIDNLSDSLGYEDPVVKELSKIESVFKKVICTQLEYQDAQNKKDSDFLLWFFITSLENTKLVDSRGILITDCLSAGHEITFTYDGIPLNPISAITEMGRQFDGIVDRTAKKKAFIKIRDMMNKLEWDDDDD